MRRHAGMSTASPSASRIASRARCRRRATCASRRARRVRHAARSIGLRQDDDAADDRRLRDSPTRVASASATTTSRDCRSTSATSASCSRTTPCFRTCPCSRTSPMDCRCAGSRATDVTASVGEVLALVGLAGYEQQFSSAAFRRRAAERRAGARDRHQAARAAVRRAVVQPRRETARADAQRHPRPAAAAGDHDDLRHPRPGRSDGRFRPHRRHEPGQHRAGRHGRGSLSSPRIANSSRRSSDASTCCAGSVVAIARRRRIGRRTGRAVQGARRR